MTTAEQRRRLGANGERIAERELVAAGMVVLDRNWRCRDGEIDLVLRDGDDLVICEVKTRRGLRCGSPHEALTATKLSRLKRLGERWIAEHLLHPPGFRIDLVAIVDPGTGGVSVDHVRGIC